MQADCLKITLSQVAAKVADMQSDCLKIALLQVAANVGDAVRHLHVLCTESGSRLPTPAP